MHFDARRSLRELDLTPRSIQESLADAVDWLRAGNRVAAMKP
jgi:hypothetical protein